MKCPKCKKEIPDTWNEHFECGWKKEQTAKFVETSKITDLDQIITEGANILAKCYEAVKEILGHPPRDQEVACVNSLYI